MSRQSISRYSNLLFFIGAIACQAAEPDYSKMSAEERDKEAKKSEQWEPVPAQIGFNNTIPSDAVVLFDGKDLSNFVGKNGKAAKWTVANEVMTVKPHSGGIRTKASFCDVQLHIEWRSPAKSSPKNKGQQWGNSGIYFMGRYEIQVLNSHQNSTYVNGQAGAIYKQYPPLVNASTPATTWQTYDIIFTAPRFDEKGALTSPAYMTALHNGVLIQNHSEIKGPTVYIGKPKYKAHGCAPISLQDHGEAVSYRQIWARNL